MFGASQWRRAVVAATVLGLSTAITTPSPLLAGPPRETERQTREFKISVDGTERGTCVMRIRTRDDGTQTMRGEASLRFRYIIYNYSYSSTGTELWRNGRLLQLENEADFNGTQYKVKAIAAANGVRVNVDGKTSTTDAACLVTTYWQLPDRCALAQATDDNRVTQASARTAEIPATHDVCLLDSDQGREFHGKLQRIGETFQTVAGKRIPCTHYRITGDVDTDLWFDAGRRLVRQESIESGHKTKLELMRVTAE